MEHFKEFFSYWYKRLFPNWKHAVIKVPVFLLVLYGLMSALFYVTSTPEFCSLCKEMRPYYEVWKKTTHANVTCIACHVEPGFVNKVRSKMIAMKELYLHLTGNFEIPIVPKDHTPADRACRRCHSEKKEYTLKGDLKMSHLEHSKIIAKEPLRGLIEGDPRKLVKLEGASCVYCHFNVVHAPTEHDRRPQMEFCMDNCHDGKKATEKCSDCHTKKGVPSSHLEADWLNVHGARSTDPQEKCESCHKWRPTNFCRDCHKQRPKSHTATWRTFHQDKVKMDRESCRACHQDKYCMKCHGIQP